MAKTHPIEASEPLLLHGRYELGRKLGEGSYGEVYEAFDVQLDRAPVAIKILRSLVINPASKERFRREATALSRLNGHPHVVRVLDGRFEGPSCFIVMERLEGTTLRDWIQQYALMGKFPSVQVVRTLFTGIVDGVAAAHRAGIVHRDLKPENIFLQRNGQGELSAKVLDFGIAQLADSRLTDDGQVFGTRGYQSPELMRGDNDQVGPWSDTYSLGVVLLEMLLPHRLGSSLPAVSDWAKEPPRSLCRRLKRLRSDVPSKLWLFIIRAVFADSKQRFQSAASMAVPMVHRSASARQLLTGTLAVAASCGVGIVIWALLQTQGRFAPLDPLPAGSVLLLTAGAPDWWRDNTEQDLCKALLAVNPDSRCERAPWWLRVPERRLAWAPDNVAALVLTMDADKVLHGRLRNPLPLPSGPIRLAAEAVPSGPAQPVRHAEALVLSALASQVEDADRPGYVPPHWNLSVQDVGAVGEDIALLGAYLRYAIYGSSPPGSMGTTDAELILLGEISQRCQIQQGTRPWECWMASFLYGVRNRDQEGAMALVALYRNKQTPPDVANLAKLHGTSRACEAGMLEDAADMLLASIKRSIAPCDAASLFDKAACVVLHPNALRLSLEQLAPLRQLAELQASSLVACNQQVVRISLGNRGRWRMRARKWELAAEDFELANQIEPHPSLLLNQAESLVHIPGKCRLVPERLSPDKIRTLRGEQQVRAAFFRWLSTLDVIEHPGAVEDTSRLRALYEEVKPGASVIYDPSRTLYTAVCDKTTQRACRVYLILLSSKSSRSTADLDQALASPLERAICPVAPPVRTQQ
jgi:hypothetical protein